VSRIHTPVLTSRFCSERLPLGRGGKLAKDIDVMGADATWFRIKNWGIPDGRPFSPQEVRAGSAVVVLGDLVASKLFEGVDPIGKDVSISGPALSGHRRGRKAGHHVRHQHGQVRRGPLRRPGAA
jgi:putative ABC transport system permease protein